MKLLIDQEVCFLYFGKLYTGFIASEIDNFNKAYEILDKYGKMYEANENYVYPIETKFCIVISDPIFSNSNLIRFDLTTYKTRNKTWEHWVNNESWIKEEFDYHTSRIKASVYGLEI